MKKTLCFLLTVVIAASGLTFPGLSAAAESNTEKQIYLSGDVNLDGQLSIGDVTELQRGIAELTELSGLQTELARVDGKELSVQTATLIQKYIAEMDTGLPIGEPAGDENEGVVYTEKVMSYACVAGQVIAQQDKVTLSTAYPDVAFISDKEAIQSFVMFANFQQSDLAVEFDENSHTFTMPNSSSVVFDYADKMILFSDYTTFTTPNGCVPFNPYGRTMPASCTLFQTQPSTQYFGGDPCVLTFDYNEVPMLQKNGDFLIPMQTFCDFFMNSLNYFVQYNGEATYMIPFNAEKITRNSGSYMSIIQKRRSRSPMRWHR